MWRFLYGPQGFANLSRFDGGTGPPLGTKQANLEPLSKQVASGSGWSRIIHVKDEEESLRKSTWIATAEDPPGCCRARRAQDYRNNLILGKSDTLETFAVETNTNYSSSDYNGFRPNEGFSPAFSKRADFPGEPGRLSVPQQVRLEAQARETRRFKTLKEYSEATGQDGHSVLVDYDVFQKVSPPGADPLTLYRPSDFDFRLRPGSAPVDAGVSTAQH